MAYERQPQLQRIYRLGFAVGACAALVFAVNRCSPISPSVSKSSLRSGNGEEQKSTAHTPPQIQVLSVKPVLARAQIVADGLFLEHLNEDPASQLAPEITLSDAQLAELKAQKRTAITIPGDAPAQAVVYFEASLPQSSADAETRELAISLSRASGAGWILSIKPGGDAEADKALEPLIASLQAAVVTFPKKMPAVDEAGADSEDPAIEEFDE